MRNSRDINANQIGKLRLRKPALLAQVRDPCMNGSVQATSLALPFHAMTVDRCSTFVNCELAADLPAAVQPCEPMGNAPHKKSPPDDPAEDVTELLVGEVLTALRVNEQWNSLRRLRPGDEGYKISNRAELGRAVGADKNQIGNILGPVNKDKPWKPTGRSRYLARIRRVLELQPVGDLPVRVSRMPVLRFIADLPDAEFKVFEDEYNRRLKGS